MSIVSIVSIVSRWWNITRLSAWPGDSLDDKFGQPGQLELI
jgi:hypothetical protein